MAKHFGKVILFAAAAGAAAAGVYYYLTQKDTELDDDFDEFEDYDDFENDSVTETSGAFKRRYVSLDKDNADDQEASEPSPDKTEEFFDDGEDDDVSELKKMDGAV